MRIPPRVAAFGSETAGLVNSQPIHVCIHIFSLNFSKSCDIVWCAKLALIRNFVPHFSLPELRRVGAKPRPHRPFPSSPSFSYSCERLLSQLLSFDTHANYPGGGMGVLRPGVISLPSLLHSCLTLSLSFKLPTNIPHLFNRF